MKLNGVIDHYDDGGLLLKKAFVEKGVPAVIKSAVDLSESDRRFSDDYALVVDTGAGNEYRYPVVDAGNTLASALYFAETGSNLPEGLRKTAAANIKTALEGFGFTAPEELTKTASMELGYSDEADNSSLHKLFGLTDDNSVEMLEETFSGLSPRGKRRMAWQVKEANADFFAKLSEDTQEYAAETVGSDFAVAVDLRRTLLTDSVSNQELTDITGMAKTASADDVAEALYSFDIKHSLTHHYNRVIPDSYASVFGDSVSKTASVSRPVEVSGREYGRDSINDWFSGGGNEKLTEAFGESFSSEFSADPAGVLDSLPITHKQAIVRMIDES